MFASSMDLPQGVIFKVAGDGGSISGQAFGGPFREFVSGTRRLSGINMAAELNYPCDFSVPTKDFSTPDVGAMTEGLCFAVKEFNNGSDVYVGCMGGVGRTGLFMGCLIKVMLDFNGVSGDPVALARKWYKKHAIETREQEGFVRSFPTEPVVALCRQITDMPEPTVVFPPIFTYLSWWFGLRKF